MESEPKVILKTLGAFAFYALGQISCVSSASYEHLQDAADALCKQQFNQQAVWNHIDPTKARWVHYSLKEANQTCDVTFDQGGRGQGKLTYPVIAKPSDAASGPR